jgi:HD-like signal output (HDOD) protein
LKNGIYQTSLGDAILFHHNPSEAENEREMAAIIHLADYMTQRFQMGDLNWDENYELRSWHYRYSKSW